MCPEARYESREDVGDDGAESSALRSSKVAHPAESSTSTRSGSGATEASDEEAGSCMIVGDVTVA